ncbi:MAG: hypothetical protein KBC64_02855 [Simkaniaceae bacterium]|nr:hypothetical protein [Simkaniaceae bacterium]
MKYKTKEEKFLFALYEDKEAVQDRYKVGEKLGYSPKGIDVIVQLLTKGNFIKKDGDTEVFLTEHGIWFVENFPSS